MSIITVELTDSNPSEILTKQKLANSTSDESENESIESHIDHRDEQSSSMYIFIQHYTKQLKLVFQSIIPDLKDFKCWQIILFILFATFNAVFSILVIII